MNSLVHHSPFMTCDDAIELRDRVVRGETSSWDQGVPVLGQFAHRAGARAPLVEIPHQYGGAVLAAPVDVFHDRADLVASAKARQVKVNAHRAQANALDEKIAPHGSARLESGQVHRVCLDWLEPPAHQQGITVPPQARGALGYR